jgi:hypothetical protein
VKKILGALARLFGFPRSLKYAHGQSIHYNLSPLAAILIFFPLGKTNSLDIYMIGEL